MMSKITVRYLFGDDTIVRIKGKEFQTKEGKFTIDSSQTEILKKVESLPNMFKVEKKSKKTSFSKPKNEDVVEVE